MRASHCHLACEWVNTKLWDKCSQVSERFRVMCSVGCVLVEGITTALALVCALIEAIVLTILNFIGAMLKNKVFNKKDGIQSLKELGFNVVALLLHIPNALYSFYELAKFGKKYAENRKIDGALCYLRKNYEFHIKDNLTNTQADLIGKLGMVVIQAFEDNKALEISGLRKAVNELSVDESEEFMKMDRTSIKYFFKLPLSSFKNQERTNASFRVFRAYVSNSKAVIAGEKRNENQKLNVGNIHTLHQTSTS